MPSLQPNNKLSPNPPTASMDAKTATILWRPVPPRKHAFPYNVPLHEASHAKDKEQRRCGLEALSQPQCDEWGPRDNEQQDATRSEHAAVERAPAV